MNILFYCTLIAFWGVLLMCTQHMLETAQVHLTENGQCSNTRKRVRRVILMTMMTFGTIAHYSLMRVYDMHLMLVQ